MELQKDYFKKRPGNDKLHIAYFSHNSYWTYASYLNECLNTNICYTGGNPCYYLDLKEEGNSDFDIFILYSSRPYDIDTFDELVDIAKNDSAKESVVAYYASIPVENATDSIEGKVLLKSTKQDDITYVNCEERLLPLYLFDIAVKYYDEQVLSRNNNQILSYQNEE